MRQSTRNQIPITQQRKFSVIIPPTLTEQKAIATALSDVDALIASLEQTITKKKAIKQGAMQQLLTGKTRVKGFEGSGEFKQTEVGLIPEDWEVNCLGNLVSYTKGFAFKSADYADDGIRIIRVSDTLFDRIVNKTPVYISEYKVNEFEKWKLYTNDLILSTVGSKPPMYDSMVGNVVRVTEEHLGSLLNQNAVRIRAKEEPTQVFLYYALKRENYISHIEKIYRGNANQASITLVELFDYSIPIPRTLTEQKAIAQILTDMDAEITQIESKKAKYQAIKQGMMQELLTGKTRLV